MSGRLPPGQIETKRFPVVGERAPSSELASAPAGWALLVDGLVERPLRIGLDEFVARATDTVTFDVHCVTGWTRFDTTWTGLSLRHVLAEAGVGAEAGFVSFQAYSDRGHHTSLPLEVARDHSWLVHSVDGEPLALEHGGPVRVVTPGRYFYKSLKWVRHITLLADDRLGWWEENSSYHNVGDPWAGDQRFTTGSIRPEQLRRFRNAPGFDKYRGRVMLGLDLRDWEPLSPDLRRLYLKNCDLRQARLAGADLRESNLSLSDLRGADLRGADLSGSDLEGANFVGADLSGANLSRTALSATRFCDESGVAVLTGADFEQAWGLLEDQERSVRSGILDPRPGER